MALDPKQIKKLDAMLFAGTAAGVMGRMNGSGKGANGLEEATADGDDNSSQNIARRAGVRIAMAQNEILFEQQFLSPSLNTSSGFLNNGLTGDYYYNRNGILINNAREDDPDLALPNSDLGNAPSLITIDPETNTFNSSVSSNFDYVPPATGAFMSAATPPDAVPETVTPKNPAPEQRAELAPGATHTGPSAIS